MVAFNIQRQKVVKVKFIGELASKFPATVTQRSFDSAGVHGKISRELLK